jgi:hypothetical protein
MKNKCFSFALYAVFGAALFFSSCDILRDNAFEVTGWNPGEGFHDPAAVKISLAFSNEPNKVSVERSFSIAEDGKLLSGTFAWSASTFFFIPSAPLEANRNYVIALETGAKDTSGVSLERRQEYSFTTRSEKSRPALLESIPADGETISGERETIRLKFSQAMDRASLAALSFSPQISGVWSLEENGYCAVFTPSESWVNGKNYRLAVDAALTNERGLSLGVTTNRHFFAGADHESPVMLAAYACKDDVKTPLTVDDGSVFENSGWGKDHKLELVFSKPVDSSSVLDALSTSPSLGFVLESSPGRSDTLLFRLASEPEWGTSFIIHLSTAVKDAAGNTSARKNSFHVKADDPSSKPPELAGIRLPLQQDGQTLAAYDYKLGENFPKLTLNSSSYPYTMESSFWIELYFDAASIDKFSLMDCFSLSASNNAFSFSPREVKFSGFTVNEAASGWESLCRVEIRGLLTNQVKPGVITLSIKEGLRDGNGNRSGKAFYIILNK